MDLFTYGTLRSTVLMQAVAGQGPLDPQHATLGTHRVTVLSGVAVPHISVDGQCVAEGVLWRGLSEQQMQRLALYEEAFGYTLREVQVKSDGQNTAAKCFFPPDSFAGTDADWELVKWEVAHLAPAVLAAEELFLHNPLPDPVALRRMWPMIEARAWAKHRAAAAPAQLRYSPQPEDLKFQKSRAPQGSFFRIQGFEVTHRTFDSGRSDVLHREVFFGIDAALVLPFDPVRDRVLLVEQMRMGPAARRDPNPWMLEPVAGIVDARETPEEAAFREAREEANLSLTRLEPAGRYYCSPGSSTDYFYNYIGLCSLADEGSYLGGLPDEAEDLRLHVLSFERAMELADTGEIATGPLLYLLHWLARHRDRLRSTA